MRALRVISTSLALSCLLVVASGCGDDDRRTTPDAGPRVDGATVDGPTGTDSGPRPDGGGTCDGVDCSDMDDACNVGMCNPATGACEAEPRPDGTSCSDMCSTGGSCTAGTCTGGTAVDCTAMDDACHTGVCDPTDGSCTAMPRADGTSCDDGMACTAGDVCTAGTCAGGAVDCSPMMDACNSAACDPTTGMCVRTPVADGMACDDMSTCTSGDACAAGVCTGTAMDCTALDTGCTVGRCNPTTAMCEAANAPDGTTCNDANLCTMADVCTSGVCVGTSLPQCNAVCTSATRVMNGTTLPAQDVSFGMDNLTFTGCGTAAANHALYYVATVPAGEALTVTATPLSSWNPVIRLLPTCGATTCLGNSNSGITGEPEVIFYTNSGTAPVDVVIAVGSSNTTYGSFDLGVRIGPAPSNRVCASATPVMDGTALTGQQGGLGTDTLPATGTTGCGTATLNRVLYYSAVVPAGFGLTANATPIGGWNPAIRVLPTCGATACLAASNSGFTGEPEVQFYANTTGAPQPVIIAVGSTSATAFGSFDLAITLRALPPNLTCATATTVMNGTVLTNQQQGYATDDLTFAGCGTSTYDALWYTATIPAGQRLTATVTPSASFDPNIRILPMCGATTCRANVDLGFSGDPETVQYLNTTASAQTVVIAVGSYSATAPHGVFDVSVTIATPPPAPYTESMIAAACQDMTTAMVLADVVGDDANSATSPLPFPMTVARTAVTHYSVATNGYISMLSSASASGSAIYTNEVIPSPGPPDGFVAPFWDDLIAGVASDARVLTVGTTPSRVFVVEWRDWELYSGVPGTVRFQAKFYETTNVIEFHYCTLAGTDPQFTGASATVGVEASTGLDGYQHSFDSAGSVSTANAIRLTPVP